MPNYRHIVRLPYTSGLPEDVAVNVYHTACDNDAEAAAFADLLVTFYQAIDQFLSVLLSTAANAASVTTYDLSDPEPRVPTDVQLFTLSVNTATLPPEVALCMSFQGIKIPGQPQARRRGRVYLGPCGTALSDSATGRPNPTSVATITTAADALLTSANSAGIVWGVLSVTDNQLVPIDNGWFDNEWDTVRGRGRKPTGRNVFS